MHCPFCRHNSTQVLETRYQDNDNKVKRKRKCDSCGEKFLTFEAIDLTFPLVIKKDGSKQAYQNTKLQKSLILALRKRPISLQTLHDTVTQIENKLLTIPKEVSSQQIGSFILDALKVLDEVAYIRFASVYRNFDNIADFNQVMQEINQNSTNS